MKRRSRPSGTTRYGRFEDWLVLEEELPVVKEAAAGRLIEGAYSPETQDWFVAQRLLNRLLTRAVNGVTDFRASRPRDWLYMFVYGSPRSWRGRLRPSSEPKNLSVTDGPITSALRRHVSGSGVGLRGLHAMLKEGEDFLEGAPKEVTTTQVVKQVGKRDLAGIGERIQERTRKDLAKVEGSVSLYLHGSMATGDFTAFSDIDDLVIVHREAWQSFEDLRRVVGHLERNAAHLQVLDPLQHHGHWVYSDLDLVCLDESIMPLSVLDEAVTIVGREEVRADVRLDSPFRHQIVWDLVQQVRRDASALQAGRLDAYRLKALVSTISLLPALIAQLRGNNMGKKEAIETCHTFLSPTACEAVRWATSVRRDWMFARGTRARVMRSLDRILPARRPALDRLGQLLAPRVIGDIVAAEPETFDAIFALTEESVQSLRAEVDQRKAPPK